MGRAARSTPSWFSVGVPYRVVFALGTGLFGLGLSVGGYGAYVPVLVASGVAPGVAGAGTSVFLLGQVIAVLPADRVSRRHSTARLTVVGFAVATVGAALTARLALLPALGSRTLVGVGQGTAFVAAMKHVGQRTTGSDTATAQGFLGAAFTLGFAVGLAGTPPVLTVSVPAPAVVSAAVIGAGAAGTLTIASSVRSTEDIVPSVRAYLASVRSPVGATLALGNAVTFGFLLVAGTWYAELLGRMSVPVTPTLVGFALTTVAGRALGGVASRRLGEPATVVWALAGQTVVLGSIAVAVAVGAPSLMVAGIVLTGFGFGVPFGPLFSLAFAEFSPDPGITLVGMLTVGNLVALVYPWFVGRLLGRTASFAPGFVAMAVTVGVVVAAMTRTLEE